MSAASWPTPRGVDHGQQATAETCVDTAEQDAAARVDDVADDGHGAEHGPADAAGDPDDASFAIADGRDSVQRALDAGAVVVAEGPDPLETT